MKLHKIAVVSWSFLFETHPCSIVPEVNVQYSCVPDLSIVQKQPRKGDPGASHPLPQTRSSPKLCFNRIHTRYALVTPIGKLPLNVRTNQTSQQAHSVRMFPCVPLQQLQTMPTWYGHRRSACSEDKRMVSFEGLFHFQHSTHSFSSCHPTAAQDIPTTVFTIYRPTTSGLAIRKFLVQTILWSIITKP